MRIYLYAFPEEGGGFAESVEEFRVASADIAYNSALQYPIHVTVTNGFECSELQLGLAIAAMDSLICSSENPIAVAVGNLRSVPRKRSGTLWFDIQAPQLMELAKALSEKLAEGPAALSLPLQAGSLHLTLANRHPSNKVKELLTLAHATVKNVASARWSVGFFERCEVEKEWILHRAWPLSH